MCERAVEEKSPTLEFVPDHLKTQEMCERAVEENPYTLKFVSDPLNTKKLCERAIEEDPYTLTLVPDHFKMKEMCDKEVSKDTYALKFVPVWFMMQELIKIWHDDNDYCDDDDELIEQYEGNQKRKTQKAQTEKELMPIAWHPSRWWNWCVPEDEQKQTEKLLSAI